MTRRVMIWIGRFLLVLSIGILLAEGKEDAEKAADGILIGEPVTYKNLAIFPLYLEKEEKVEDYIILEEAFDAGLVEIREVDGSGTVNAVEVENKGKRPIYILAGTVIVGGKQDRVVTKDTIVPPCATIKVEVCCVEQGRWHPRTRRGEGGAFDDVEKASTESAIRRLVQEKGKSGQRDVWRKVAESCQKQRAETETGTYRRLIEVTEKKVQEYLAVFEEAFGDDEDICGFLVAINGVIETCDLFASPELLGKFKDNLLRSYIIDALNAGPAEEAEPPAVDAGKKFIDEMTKAEKQVLEQDEHRQVERLDAARIMGFLNRDKKSKKTLHLNTYRKK